MIKSSFLDGIYLFIYLLHIYFSVLYVCNKLAHASYAIQLYRDVSSRDVIFYLNTEKKKKKKNAWAQPAAHSSEDAGYNSISSRVP